MLLLSRKPGESIDLTLGTKQIKVTILAIHGGQIRLGFTGDPSIKILRSELTVRDKNNGRK